MLNNPSVVKESYGTRTTILVDENNSTAVSCMVKAGETVIAGQDGKKIALAGSFLKGDLQDRDGQGKEFEVVTEFEDKTGIVGNLLHDVDVTNGPANAQVVIFGTIDASKVDATIASYMATVKELNGIKYIK